MQGSQATTETHGSQNPKKRRKTHSSQQAHLRHKAAKLDEATLQPLSEQWQQTLNAIKHLVAELSPTHASEPSQLHLFKTVPEQLQALLNSLVAARGIASDGLLCALGAVVGKWVHCALQQPDSSADTSSMVDMVIGMLIN